MGLNYQCDNDSLAILLPHTNSDLIPPGKLNTHQSVIYDIFYPRKSFILVITGFI